MLANQSNTNALANPIAIYEKDLRKNTSFQLETFELCTMCGARFGIGYFGDSKDEVQVAEEIRELPQKLIQILAKDHRHDRQHKCLIELDH
ncbi:MAG TPA: hypothetical protein VFE02_10390 [Candidatus Acidoferrales bacterium]|nr:hypothetical protein [Candidatus Acidoferrales bacterium]